jgi:hypothetical protein
VKLVVTISIKYETMRLSCADKNLFLVSHGYGVRTGSSSPARCTASLKLSRTNNEMSVTGESYIDGTTTTTTQLDLPFDKIVDRLPHQILERGLKIHEQVLKSFAESI